MSRLRQAITPAAVLLPALLLTGCAVGPRYEPPVKDLAAAWHEPADSGLAAGDADIAEWWQVFADPQLSELIARAAEENLDLRMAILRVRHARALRGVAVGALLPTLSGQSRLQRTKPSFAGFSGLGGGTGRAEQFRNTVTRGVATSAVAESLAAAAPGAAGLAAPLASGVVGLVPNRGSVLDAPEYDLFAAGFDAAWELDVFGGLRRDVESADAELAAAMADFRAVQVSLLAEVATTYIDVRTLQAEIAATLRNIELQRETLGLAQTRLKFELASDLEVRQAETNLATTEARLPQLEAGLAAAMYRLGVLIGREPDALIDELNEASPIPQPPTETFVGVPADVLRRRPDIRGAERRLASATAKIGVAAADLYPRFSLTGTFGVQTTEFDAAFDSHSITYGFGPAVRWNIFDGLRNLNRIAAQEADTQYAFAAYEQTVLQALQDVETAMIDYKREQVRRDALIRAAEAARHTVRLAEERYQDGFTDFQDVVDAERSLVSLETLLVQSQGQVAIDLVALYKALGGGWSPGVVPQEVYLTAPSPARDHPVDYFLTGGRTGPPWMMTPPGAVPADAAAPVNQDD